MTSCSLQSFGLIWQAIIGEHLQKRFQAGRYGGNIVYIDVTIFTNLNRFNASIDHAKFMFEKTKQWFGKKAKSRWFSAI